MNEIEKKTVRETTATVVFSHRNKFAEQQQQ